MTAPPSIHKECVCQNARAHGRTHTRAFVNSNRWQSFIWMASLIWLRLLWERETVFVRFCKFIFQTNTNKTVHSKIKFTLLNEIDVMSVCNAIVENTVCVCVCVSNTNFNSFLNSNGNSILDDIFQNWWYICELHCVRCENTPEEFSRFFPHFSRSFCFPSTPSVARAFDTNHHPFEKLAFAFILAVK